MPKLKQFFWAATTTAVGVAMASVIVLPLASWAWQKIAARPLPSP